MEATKRDRDIDRERDREMNKELVKETERKREGKTNAEAKESDARGNNANSRLIAKFKCH